MGSTDREFLQLSGRYLSTEFLPKIRAAITPLTEDEIWWRPHETSNSIGNLLLHLAGNLRQWIVSGVGAAPDTRTRQAEFETRDRVPADQLLDRLTRVVEDAVETFDGLSEDRLLDSVTIQGRTVTVTEAIYHAVEHFSMHTGQILYIAKLHRGEDLGFYDVVEGIPRARWEGRARD